MAGLRLASIMASTVHLRCESLRLVSCLEEKVSSIRLDRIVLERVEREVNRLTKAYSPAIAIIRLLIEAQGIVFEGQNTKTTLPGFMFDMNTFFQVLVSRFLKDNLLEYSVYDEVGLKGMMRYSPMFNPQRRISPTPRPDYVLTNQGKIVSILDAKYRDLWERQLPSEMLYQLVVYAISNPKLPQSSILYPTTNAQSKEARINITHPVSGKFIGQVCLRPVHIPTIVELVATKNSQRRRDSQNYAKLLAFGANDLSLDFPVKPSKC
jgi:5-methylcytosine-specific restriction enzyme subunit McrC